MTFPNSDDLDYLYSKPNILMKLLNSQKNELYDLITEFDSISPSQFDLYENEVLTSFIYKNTDYRFTLSYNRIRKNAPIYLTYSPGGDFFKENDYVSDFDSVTPIFFNWLDNLISEISAPNKWDRLMQEMKNIRGLEVQDQTMFSHSEFISLTQQMKQIKDSLRTIALTSEQTLALESKFDHLLTIANNLNKYDWQNLFIGTIISIIITLNVTQENAEALHILIKQVFNGYFL